MSGLMAAAISSIHVISCVALIVSILLQSGKGGGLAGAFGQGSSQTLFGGRGAATFLTRASTTLAVIFFLTSLTLGLTSSHRVSTAGKSLIQEEARKHAEEQASPSSTTPGGPAGTAPGGATPGSMTPPPSNPPTSTSPAPPTQGGTTPQGSGGSK